MPSIDLGMKNTGKSAEQIFDDHWARFGKIASVVKFEDQAALVGLNRGKIVKSSGKPCDRILTFGGRTVFVEIKSSNNPTSFPFSMIRKGQIGAAIEHTAAGGEYHFFIKSYTTGKWYRVPWPVIAEVRARGRGSIPWSHLTEFETDIHE